MSQDPQAKKGDNNQSSLPIQLIIRDKQGWRLCRQDAKTGQLTNQTKPRECSDAAIVFSADGSYFAVLVESGIEIYESYSGQRLLFLEQAKVRHVYFSPLNNYLVSYHHRKQADKVGNCWVWKLNLTTNNNKNNSNNNNNNEEKSNNNNNNNNNKNNLDNSVIYTFFLSEFDTKHLPLAFSNDEYIGARINKNGILIHDIPRLQYKSNNILCKIDIPKIECVNIAPIPLSLDLNSYPCTFLPQSSQVPKKNYLIATFAKAVNNKPANVVIYNFDYSHCKSSNMPYTIAASQAIMSVDSCELLWNIFDYSSMMHGPNTPDTSNDNSPNKNNNNSNNNNNKNSRKGSGMKYVPMLLALASSDIDHSGQSYYGNQVLYLLNPNRNESKRIVLSEKGKLLCAKWHPNGKYFFIIDNFPIELSQYNLFGNLYKKYGKMARNDIIFSMGHDHPGRFMFLAGFGNLNGEMSFYDCAFAHSSKIKTNNNNNNNSSNNNNKNNNITDIITQIGYNKDESCRYYEWAPNGETVLCARLYPYRMVDNGFRIYKYNGTKLYDFSTERLYQVLYRPNLSILGYYPNPNVNLNITNKDIIKMNETTIEKQTKIKKSAYVPPHLRAKKAEMDEIEQQQEEADKLKEKKRRAKQKKIEKQKAKQRELQQQQQQQGDEDDWDGFGIVSSKNSKNNNNKNDNNNENAQGSEETSENQEQQKKRKRKKKNKENKPGLDATDESAWPRGSKFGQTKNDDNNDNNNNNGNGNGNGKDDNSSEQQSGGKRRRRKKKSQNNNNNNDDAGDDNNGDE